MKKFLVIIYHFQISQNQGENFSPPDYRILYILNEMQILDEACFQGLAELAPANKISDISFLNLDDLKSFALKVANFMNRDSIRLVSVQDFNIGLEEIKKSSEFEKIYFKFGDMVELKGGNRKKGLWGKFFS